MSISLRPGQERDRDDLARALIDLQYTRNDMDFHRGTFRAVSYTHLDVYKRQGIYCPKTGAKILYDCMKRKGMTEGLWLFRIAP